MTTATELAEEQAEAPPTPSQRAAELARMDPQRAMLELAWPGIVGNLTSTLGQAAIFAFVGHLGAVATAAVGASWQFLFLLFPVWRSLAIGTMAHVSRRMGEGRIATAADVTRQSLVLGAVAGLAFGVFFVVFARPLLTLIGATDEVAAIGVPILAIVGGTSLFTTVWYIGVSAMSAAGDTRTPMWMAVLSAVLGVPLGYLFLIVLALGPIGAAYASVLDSAVVCVVVLVLRRGLVAPRSPARALGDVGEPAIRGGELPLQHRDPVALGVRVPSRNERLRRPPDREPGRGLLVPSVHRILRRGECARRSGARDGRAGARDALRLDRGEAVDALGDRGGRRL
ncbi:MAG: hypothetical protein E6I20_05880, partial [Chloroflexi bacterium]